MAVACLSREGKEEEEEGSEQRVRYGLNAVLPSISQVSHP